MSGLATKAQLWVLNRAGWVELRKTPDDTRGVTSSQADAAIKESIRLDGGAGRVSKPEREFL